MKVLRLLLALMLGAAGSHAVAETLQLGVLAPRGKLEAQVRWAEFGRFLTQRMGATVEIVPLNPPDVVRAARSGEVKFVLSNPVHVLELTENDRATILASLVTPQGSQFGGVIVTKHGAGLLRSSDLVGKKAMSLNKSAAGGYVFQAYHLKQKGVDVHKDLAELRIGKQQDDLVLAVGAGVADAAFVRTGILEAMAKGGKIRMNEFDVVDEHKVAKFPFRLTTALYPEWYLVAMPGVSRGTAAKMKSIVLKMNPNDKAAKTARIRGFIEPISIDPMKQALQSLKLAPYNK